MGEDAFSLSYLHHSSAQVSKCTVDSRARVRTSRQLQTQFRDKRTSTLILLSQLARSAHRSCSAAIVPSLRQVLQKLHLNLHGHALLQLLHLPLHLQIQLHSTCVYTCTCAARAIDNFRAVSLYSSLDFCCVQLLVSRRFRKRKLLERLQATEKATLSPVISSRV